MAFQYAASSDLLACWKVTHKWFNLSSWQTFSPGMYLECTDNVDMELGHTKLYIFVFLFLFFRFLMMDSSTAIQKF